MNTYLNSWLVIGIPQNWETALSQPVPIWGLKERYKLEFQTLSIGDVLWLYATRPVKGVVGVGAVKDKYVDNVNLVWPEELEKGKTIWPLRFRIHILKILPRSLWKTERIRIDDFRLFWQLGFQKLTEKHATELLKRAGRTFKLSEAEDIYRGATLAQVPIGKEKQDEYVASPYAAKEFTPDHKELQETIAEIGKLQYYYTEVEYPLELKAERRNLDVVWKREVDGVPTFAFEIELSGMLERAVERLKVAYKKWNSRPRIIVPEKYSVRVQNIIATTDKDFKNEIRTYQPSQVTELLTQKRNLKSLEQTLSLY